MEIPISGRHNLVEEVSYIQIHAMCSQSKEIVNDFVHLYILILCKVIECHLVVDSLNQPDLKPRPFTLDLRLRWLYVLYLLRHLSL